MPSLHVHVDALGGVAGDMLLGAMLDAWPDQFDGVETAIRQAGVPNGIAVRAEAHHDHTLSGHRFVVEVHGEVPTPAGRFRDVRDRLEASDLPAPVRERALAIFSLLAEAEGVVHGVAADDVVLHEVAGWDSVADIVGIAHLLEALPVESWSVSTLPIGRGRVDTEHGPLPVPAPATAELLKGFVMADDGIGGERVTPTGAAILRHLSPTQAPLGAVRIQHVGVGFGTRRLAGISNVVRLVVYETGETSIDAAREQIAVVSFEVDDQTPEDLAIGLQSLRARDGVLDVVQSPVFGKKGRMMASVQVLCVEQQLPAVLDACFVETTTIGVRWRIENRAVLSRHATDDGVKIVERPHGRTAKMDVEMVRDVAGGASGRSGARHRGERRALGDADD